MPTIIDNTIEYRGYKGSVEWSEGDGFYFGRVLGIEDSISYEGDTTTALYLYFAQAVDDYIETQKEIEK